MVIVQLEVIYIEHGQSPNRIVNEALANCRYD